MRPSLLFKVFSLRARDSSAGRAGGAPTKFGSLGSADRALVCSLRLVLHGPISEPEIDPERQGEANRQGSSGRADS
jgi:hypothetical protein